jgi:hypothetical protein
MEAFSNQGLVRETYNYGRIVGRLSIGIALRKELPLQAQKAYYFRLPRA